MSNQVRLVSKNKNVLKEKSNLQRKVSTDNHVEPHSINLTSGSGIHDWLELKLEIDGLLQNSHKPADLLQKSREVSDYWNKVRVQMKNG